MPAKFSFCVKLPKAITHERRLRNSGDLLDAFMRQVEGLGERLACLLLQLPPSLVFDSRIAQVFFETLRCQWAGRVALEPRHASWFDANVDALLSPARVARVLADPVRLPPGKQPGGSSSFVYVQLHGSPRMDYSSYEPALIVTLAKRIAMELRAGRDVWCIFDNTASGAAAQIALALKEARARSPDKPDK